MVREGAIFQTTSDTETIVQLVARSKKKDILNKIPLHRIGSPQDIADCVLFLLYKADYITGQIIAVDGGRSV